jgi:exopolysaccharide biosynthesis polyprenyl glycosylphosphotransferase
MKNNSHAQKSVPWRLRSSERKMLLLIGDLLVGYASLFVALYYWARGDAWLKFSWEFIRVRPEIWFYLMPILWVIFMSGLYDVRRSGNRGETVRGIGMAALISLGIYLLVFFISEPNSLPRRGVAGFIVANTVLIFLWRMLYIRIFTAPQFMRRVLVIGAGKAGNTLLNVLSDLWPPPFYVVGLVDDDPEKLDKIIAGYPVLGNGPRLLQIIEREQISDIILAISGEMNGTTFQSILDAQECGVEVNTMQRIYEELLGRVPIFHLDADWLLRSFVEQSRSNPFYELIKRVMDLVIALVGIVALAVLFPFISLAILLDTGFPVFFLQNRMGKNGKEYKIIKFRTMVQNSEKKGEVRVTTQNDDRITRAGKFLRRSHLDELPQFINILRGEMSMVGPRAERSELVTELQEQIPFYRARLLVKPGITGWAQVNFGYATTVEDTAVKLEYDLYYIKHRNLLMDILIIVRTIGTVVGLRGQ